MNFRSDINGLRAIAVISVMVFHFLPKYLPGGFAGVDIFFVISGYLMTAIVLNSIDKKEFSFFKFYMARANRIIPSLSVLCLFLFIFGGFYLNSIDFKELGKHAFSSLTFISNIVYWQESGYFDTSSQNKWLLHTWSLSVEWQFYIIYPILLLFLNKITSRVWLSRILVVITFLFFLFSFFSTLKWPNGAYYLLPTRAWEMMVGGVAFLYPIPLTSKKKVEVELLGVLFVLGSLFFIDNTFSWPGFFAIVPVLGAYLIIISNNNESIFTSNFIFQSLGKWSYSIYLWHWPIVVGWKYFSIPLSETVGMILSILMGFLSYSYIESQRSIFKFKATCSSVLPFLVIFLSCFLGGIVYIHNGFPERSNLNYFSNLNEINSFKIKGQVCHNITTVQSACRGGSNGHEVVLVGDSHAGTLGKSIYSMLDLTKNSFTQFTSDGCTLLNTLQRTDIKGNVNKKCSQISDEVSQYIESKKSSSLTIVYVIRGPLYISGKRFDNTLGGKENGGDVNVSSLTSKGIKDEIFSKLTYWSSLGHKLILVYPIPEMGWNVPDVIKSYLVKGGTPLIYNDSKIPSISVPLSVYLDRSKEVAQIYDSIEGDNIYRVYPKDVFCVSDNACLANTSNALYYFDDNHLSSFGAELLGNEIVNMIP